MTPHRASLRFASLRFASLRFTSLYFASLTLLQSSQLSCTVIFLKWSISHPTHVQIERMTVAMDIFTLAWMPAETMISRHSSILVLRLEMTWDSCAERSPVEIEWNELMLG